MEKMDMETPSFPPLNPQSLDHTSLCHRQGGGWWVWGGYM